MLDSGVPEAMAKFLADRDIVKPAAFADLADRKSDIIEVVGRPAGLEPADAVAC